MKTPRLAQDEQHQRATSPHNQQQFEVKSDIEERKPRATTSVGNVARKLLTSNLKF
jgi:hypothetical protein